MRIMSGEERGVARGTFLGNADFYQTQTWVHKAIKVLKDSIAPLDINVVEQTGDSYETKDNHPLNDVLDYPNEEMSQADFWGEWVVNMMLGGEQGVELVMNQTQNAILEMYPREPHIFHVKPEKKGKRYRKVAGYKIDDGYGPDYILDPEEFIHFKFYNPLNPWRGLAPITAVRIGIIIDQLAQAWTRLFFRNQARPDYALIAPNGLTKTERDEYMNELMRDYGTGEGLHKPIILEDGVTDIKPFSFPPKDVEWLEQRKFNRDEVGALFGVPDEIMGYGRDTYENFDTADRVLWTLTLVPLIRFRDDGLTRFFRKNNKIERGLEVRTNLTMIPQLQEDKTSKIDQLDRLANRGYPVNELNEYLGLGLPEVEGGDIGYIPVNLVPISEAGAFVTPRVDNLGINDPKNKMIGPEYGSAEHEAIWGKAQKQIDKQVDSMRRALKRYFQDQQNEINARLRNSRIYGRGKFQSREPERIPTPEDLFDFEQWVDEFIKRFGPPVAGTVAQVGQNELDGLGIDLLFDVDAPLVRTGIEHILRTVAQKVNDTTWNGLIGIIQESELAGEGIPSMQERINNFFGGRKSDYQTERIARTTMTGASNFADQQAWDQSEVVKKKIWISALLPGRTRDEHAAAHNQRVGINEMFVVGNEQLEYPGDPNGSPGNIINCLCVMIPEVEE